MNLTLDLACFGQPTCLPRKNTFAKNTTTWHLVILLHLEKNKTSFGKIITKPGMATHSYPQLKKSLADLTHARSNLSQLTSIPGTVSTSLNDFTGEKNGNG